MEILPVLPGTPADRRKDSAANTTLTGMIDDPRLAERVGQYLLCIPETFAWYTHQNYEGHSLKRKGNGWFLVVHCRDNGNRMVCFYQGDTIGRVFQQFAIAIASDLVTWHQDQYA